MLFGKEKTGSVAGRTAHVGAAVADVRNGLGHNRFQFLALHISFTVTPHHHFVVSVAFKTGQPRACTVIAEQRRLTGWSRRWVGVFPEISTRRFTLIEHLPEFVFLSILNASAAPVPNLVLYHGKSAPHTFPSGAAWRS